MRSTARALAVLASIGLLGAAACSDDDSGREVATVTSSSSSTVTSPTTVATTTTAAPSTTVAATGPAPTTPRTTAPRATSPPPTPPEACASVPTSAPPLPAGGIDRTSTVPAAVTITNSHSAAAVVGIRGQSYTLGPGASQTLSLPGIGQVETVTAAPEANPGDRFSYGVELAPGARQTLAVKTMPAGACDGDVRRSVYLTQQSFST